MRSSLTLLLTIFAQSAAIAQLVGGLASPGSAPVTEHLSSESPTAQEQMRDEAPMSRWVGVHLMTPGHGGVDDLQRAIREGLAPLGVNVIVLEVGHGFAFDSHPELSAGAASLTHADAREIAALCRELGIRLIPEFNCLGHQSWRGNPSPLLARHPDMSETPGVSSDQLLSWCPRHPDVNAIVFDLIDEIADAFEADAFHVGMDEVFLIANDHCPRCRGADPAEVFAEAVNALHQHLVIERGLSMPTRRAIPSGRRAATAQPLPSI
jgi:hypothetical protein